MTNLTPFPAAAAPLRAKHHAPLRDLAAWALAAGRGCDLDVAAVCLDALERYRTPSGDLRLDRPTVNGVLWADVRNAASMLGTLLPDRWHVDLWTVLSWCADAGELAPDSDPLPALLEPLRCYGGLGADGYPMPEGEDVDFPCQCYVPYDPTLPPGISLHIVGHDPNDWREFLARVHLQVRTDDPPLSSYEPLFALARRLRHRRSRFAIHPDEFTYVGSIDEHRSTPKLWLYRYDPNARRGFDQLVLDADGSPWIPKADRRRGAGYRWIRTDDRRALFRSGLEPTAFLPDLEPFDELDECGRGGT
jgi:hypothetical protein